MAESQPGAQRPQVWLAIACAALVVGQHVAARAARDALFLSELSANALPNAMLGAAGVGLLTVLGVSRAISRFGPGRVIPLVLIASGLLHVLEWTLLPSFSRLAVIALYLHASVAGGITVSGFWSIVSERFDPRTTRRIAGQLAAGSAAGGVLAGVIAQRIGQTQGLGTTLLALAILSSLTASSMRALARGSAAAQPAPTASDQAAPVTHSPYLRNIAAVVILTGLAGIAVDYAFKASVSATGRDGTELLSVFAAFYGLTSVASVIVQLTLSASVLNRAGLGIGLSSLPGATVCLGFIALSSSATWSMLLLRGGAATLETSLFRAAYEPLYAPLAPEQRRATKTIIDVACSRLGEAAGSGWLLLVGAFAPIATVQAGIITAISASAVCIALSWRLERGYVNELAASLKAGRVLLDAADAADASTRIALSQTQLDLDRESLLQQIAALRGQGSLAALERPASSAQASLAVTASKSPASGDALAATSALQSGDAARIRLALRENPLDLKLVSLVIPLLERDDVSDVALRALRSVGRRIVGQLSDALLDQQLPMKLRRRIPRVLRACPEPRAVRGLAEALSDPDFGLRYRAGLALLELTKHDVSLSPPERLVVDAAHRELLHTTAKAQATVSLSETSQARATDRALEHVFNLLGLLLDRDALDLSLRALALGDDKLRGTALEYLEHVVPEPLRRALLPQLEQGRGPRHGTLRPAAEIVAELKRSLA